MSAVRQRPALPPHVPLRDREIRRSPSRRPLRSRQLRRPRRERPPQRGAVREEDGLRDGRGPGAGSRRGHGRGDGRGRGRRRRARDGRGRRRLRGRLGGALSVKVEVHADVQAFDEARWNGLLDRARLPSVFLTWQWQTEWSQAFAADRPRQILAAIDAGGDLTGLLPLYEEAPGRWRLVGGVDVSDYLDLIAPDGREEEAWRALLDHCA